MIKRFIFLILATWHLSTCATGVDLRNGNIFSFAEKSVKVAITIDNKQDGANCPAASSWMWGAEGNCPARRISSLAVYLSGTSIFVPYSAFADLGNPSEITIERPKSGKTFSIRIKGGDASTSYVAALRFNMHGILIERVVRHGEFPDRAWEKTIYKFTNT